MKHRLETRYWLRPSWLVLGASGAALSLGCAGSEPDAPAVGQVAQKAEAQPFLAVPVRWCAVEGTDLAEDPTRAVGAADLNEALIRELALASEHLYMQDTNVALRSAMMVGPSGEMNIPVIPHVGEVDGVPMPGEPGDVLAPGLNHGKQMGMLLDSCRAAWAELMPGVEQDVGFVALNVGRFCNSSGVTGLFGITLAPNGHENINGPGNRTVAITEPTKRNWPSPLWSSDTIGWDTGHEIGHSWPSIASGPDDSLLRGLRHTIQTRNVMRGGVPGDANGDTFTDELDRLSFSSSISQTPWFGETSTVDQIAVVTGAEISVPGCKLENGDDCSPLVVRVVDADPGVEQDDEILRAPTNLNLVTVSERAGSGQSVWTIESFADISASSETISYFVALDTDNNAASGGDAASQGSSTSFDGTELLVRIDVPSGGAPVVAAWRHNGFNFVSADTTGVSVEKRGIGFEWAETSGENALLLTLPNSLRGALAEPFRMQVTSQAASGGDSLGEDPELGVLVGWPEPTLPTCDVVGDTFGPLQTVTVNAAGLAPNATAYVMVGDQRVDASANTNGGGAASFTFDLPGGLRDGAHAVSVGVVGTALHAVCPLQLDLPEACQSGTDIGRPSIEELPERDISTCIMPNLQEPELEDPEQCGVKFTNDAPGVFPVGETVVTWRALDSAGNHVYKAQKVIVHLENESCCPPGMQVIHGTSGNDWLPGSQVSPEDPGPFCILGHGGQDAIFGRGEGDYLSGGPGDDVIFGSGGNDVISGNDHQDRLYGGPGDDLLLGGEGDDRLYGGSDDDVAYGGPHQDLLEGEAGNDTLFGNSGDDTLRGRSGDDIMVGGPDNNSCDDVGGAGTAYYVQCFNPAAPYPNVGCIDGAHNGLESDVDCGGPCGPCDTSNMCGNVGDCSEDDYCRLQTDLTLTCAPYPAAGSCEDGFRNGDESDVDCGGSCDVGCADGDECETGADCLNLKCEDSLCALVLAATRAHWAIENELHWVLDVAFREDDCVHW